MSSRRVWPAGMLRACAAVALALAAVTCRDAVGPGTPTRAQIAVAPILPSAAALADFGLTIDAVRFVVVRPAADTLADTTLALPPDSTELALDLRVLVVSVPETLQVSVVALSGTLPLFTGTRPVPVPSTVVTAIPVDSFVGPVADSIVIQPRAPFIALNDSLRFQVQGFNGGVPVTQFYIAWSSSDSALAPINRFGVLRAPGARGAVRIRARTPSGASDSVMATFTPPATQLVLVSGGGQTDTVGSPLPTPLAVEARAADGVGVGGVTVRFRALAGGGAVADSLVVTDAAGRASTSATLGGGLGPQSFEASVSGLTGSPVTFNAMALAGPATQLLAAAGDAQVTTVATPVSTRPAVVLRDGGGNPVAGVSVTFSVASGGGGVTGGTQTTDSSGTATVGSWTLGNLAGTNTLTASAAGLTRTFTATGVADSATQLVATAGDLQSALVDTAVATDPAVRAQDQFGNPIAGASITFSVSGGGGSVSGAAQLTNAAGTATVGGWTLGTAVGPNALQASSSGVTPVTFTATGTAGVATTIVKIAGDLQSGIVNAALAIPPRVRLVDQFGNPVAGASVTFAVTAGGGSVGGASQTTDTSGAATVGSWSLGTATGPNGLTATAGLLSATFNATALAGAPAQIAQVPDFVPTAVVGTAVPVAPAVFLRDQFNNPVVGVPVTFVDSGGGSVTGGLATTDTTGVARVGTWTLDTLAGANTLTASSGILSTNFSATGLAGLATQLVRATADSLTAIVGMFVGTAPTVRARDQYGNAVSGLGVTFAVTGGAGTVTGATPTTDTSGLATVGSWTLDTLAGANALTASAGVLPPVVFTATGIPAAPSQLLKVAGDGQTGVVNAALPVAPTVQLTDQYGNPIAGDTIDFFILTDGGSVVTPTVETDASGTASSGLWTLADFVAQNRLQATPRGSAGVPPAQFTAAGTPDAPFQLLLMSADTQTALAGQQVNLPPAVEVADQYFNPVPGVSVTFALTGPLQGSVTPSSALTDSVGVARVTTWTLDPIAGLNTLDASVPGLTAVTFSANGVTTNATTIALDNGNDQLGVVNTVLPTAYTVLVMDAGGAPVQNVLVHWAIGPDGGFINPSTSLTDVSGIASATRRLGIGVGTQTATASVPGLSGSPITFTATAVADTAFQIVKLVGDTQTVRINAAVPVRPSIRVTDAFGNPIAGISVLFTPDALGGIVTGGAQVTDTGGVATVGGWTLGGVVGTQSLTVSAGSLTPVAFTATATASAPASLAIVQGNLQTATVNTAVPVRPSVVVRDGSGNPVPGVQVTFAAGGANGSVTGASPTTDSAGVAAVGTWTLDRIMGADTLIASAAGVPSITFTATGVADVARRLLKQAGDSQTATVNTAVLTRPTARVTDQYGNPVAGRSVTWAVASGGGGLGAPVTVSSDAAGIVTSPAWTVGTAVGPNTLTASAVGLTGSPVTITAFGVAGAATQMVIKDGNNQSATVATALAVPPSVVLKDQFNNPVRGAPVVFTVLSGGGSITGATDTTDSQGIAAVGSWTLGPVAGLSNNSLRASAAGVQPVAFTATGVAGPPVRLGFLLDPPHSLAGNTIKPAIEVAIQDQFGNTVIPASDIVTLQLGATSDPAAKLVGTFDLAAVNGVAVFSDLAIDSAGIGYTLRATSPKVTGAESNRFDVGGVIAAVQDDRLDPVAAAFSTATGLVYIPGVNNAIGVFDPSKGLISSFPILQNQPFGVAVNALTNRVYVTTFATLVGTVMVLDGRDPSAILSVIPIVGEPRGIAVDEATDRIFVAVGGDPGKGAPPSLAIIDGKDNRVVVSIPFPEGALAGIGVAFNPNDRLVYVAIPNVGVGIFDPEGAKFIGAISIVGEKGAAGTHGVAIDLATKLLYATNRDDNSVSIIDIADPFAAKEMQRLRVGLLPEGLGVDSDRRAVYVGNSGDSTVSFIDAGKLSVFATLIVGPMPKAAAVNPGTGQFYVPTFTDDRVRVVQP